MCQAFQHGLANEVVPYPELASATQRWTDKILTASPLAAQAAKHAFLARRDMPLEVALMTKFEAIQAYADSIGRTEGLAVAAERRKT